MNRTQNVEAAPGRSSSDPGESNETTGTSRTDVSRNRVLDPELLKAFIAVVDYGGYTAAAQVLNRSQAAVSQQIKRLEETAQTALLQHPRHDVQLTDQGRVMLDYARRLIALNNEALNSLSPDELTGKVRIGANSHYAITVLPPLLVRFCKAYPEVQLELHTGLAADMRRQLGHAFDIVIGHHLEGSREGELLSRSQVHWLTSEHDSPHLRATLPVGLLARGSLLRDIATDALAKAGKRWHLVQESSNDAALAASAAAGLTVIVATVLPPNLRVLTEHDGMPALPGVEARMETAQRYMPRAATRLHEFLMDALVPK
ncbi:LysR substrate-binding domain-containing protein [soil metagenome]